MSDGVYTHQTFSNNIKDLDGMVGKKGQIEVIRNCTGQIIRSPDIIEQHQKRDW